MVAIIIKSIFFALQWKNTKDKIIHVATFTVQVGLCIDGFIACVAIKVVMITIGYSSAIVSIATFGAGAVVAITSMAVAYLFDWLSTKNSSGLFCLYLHFKDVYLLSPEMQICELVPYLVETINVEILDINNIHCKLEFIY